MPGIIGIMMCLLILPHCPTLKKIRTQQAFKHKPLSVGDTIFYSKGFAVLDNLTSRDNIPQPGFSPTDSASVAVLKVHAKTGSEYTMQTLLVNKSGSYLSSPDTLTAENLVVQLQRVSGNTAELGIKESDTIMQYLTLKAYRFPFINLVWLGTIIMVIGFFIAMARRIQTNRSSLRKI
jgi:cytochrome c-type biogenesis protein CcmF